MKDRHRVPQPGPHGDGFPLIGSVPNLVCIPTPSFQKPYQQGPAHTVGIETRASGQPHPRQPAVRQLPLQKFLGHEIVQPAFCMLINLVYPISQRPRCLLRLRVCVGCRHLGFQPPRMNRHHPDTIFPQFLIQTSREHVLGTFGDLIRVDASAFS